MIEDFPVDTANVRGKMLGMVKQYQQNNQYQSMISGAARF